jgi:hypothetical protein
MSAIQAIAAAEIQIRAAGNAGASYSVILAVALQIFRVTNTVAAVAVPLVA